ncbi:MAG: class I SAM-dependent methyltransferase [Rhodomicrobium sp.]
MQTGEWRALSHSEAFPGDQGHTQVRKAAQRCVRRLERGLNRLLFLVCGFDRWHVENDCLSRPYKRIISAQINRLDPRISTVVEIGCGLGDILRGIKCATRIGCDLDARVVRAARLRGAFDSIEFRTGDWTAIQETSIGAVIMVNWIHNLPPVELEKQVLAFCQRTRYLVFDSIDKEAHASYKYIHDFAFLRGRARIKDVFRVQGELRSFLIWQVS